MSITIQDVHNIQWGKSYLWEIQVDENEIEPVLPGNFSEWIPAVTVEAGISSLESHTQSFYNTSIKIPLGTSPNQISITFIDDINGSVHDWLSKWHTTTILNDGVCVSTISECTKILHVRKLDEAREILSEKSYTVYPEGVVNMTGDSESGNVQVSALFISVD